MRPVIMALVRFKYRYTCDDLSGIEGPYLLLSNHNTNFDPVFVEAAVNGPVDFVATENITRIPVAGKILRYFFDPIIHFKGKAGLKTVMNIIARTKAGRRVCMFAEGNRSFNGVTMPIPAVTGKVARKTGVPLVTFRITGGYLSCPRWAVTKRKGEMKGSLVNIYSPEMLKSMTDDEVKEAIERDL